MGRIPESKIEEIQTASDIVSTVSRYVSLKKAGKNFKGLCPFHKEKTPSFMVSAEKQIYHCFGCGKGGNVFNFIMSVENITYIEAVRKIAGDLGITIPEDRKDSEDGLSSEFEMLYQANRVAFEYFKSQSTAKSKSYLSGRKLKQETLDRFGVGYAPRKWDGLINSSGFKSANPSIFEDLGLIQKRESGNGYYDRFRDRIIFPFYHVSGRIIGFGGRRLNEADNPKYLNSPESKIYKKGELLYGLYQAIPAIREKRTVILVEGYFDLLRLVDAGIPNVIASSGTALTESQGRLIKRYTNTVIIAYDSDEAGLKAALRNSQILESVDLSVSMVLIPPPHDPDTYILEKGTGEFIQLLKNRINPIDYRLKLLEQESHDLPMAAKNEMIDTLLEEYAQIPNEVKIGLYIHKIAEKMEVPESFLIERFNRFKKRDFKRTEKEPEDRKSPRIPILRKGQWRAEEDLLAILLLNQNEVSKYIFDHISTADFANDNLRVIFEILTHQWEENGSFDLKEIENDLQDKGDMELISKLSLQTLNQPLKYAAGCIYKMRKWYYDSRYNEILRLMREEDSSSKSWMHYTKELTEIRKRLSEIEKDQSKFYRSQL